MTTALRSTTLLGLLIVGGCATTASSPAGTAGQVKRLITCNEKPGVDPADVLRLANEFAKVPGVLDVSAGRSQYADSRVPTTQPPGAITFVLTFRDQVAASRSFTDPLYVRLRDESLPAVSTSTAVATDVVLQNYLVSEQYAKETTAAVRERRAAAVKQQEEMRSRTR